MIKGLYGPLRDSGYQIETSEHPADAIKSVFAAPYLSVVLDSRDIGMTATDAAAVIKSIRPDISVIIIGKDAANDDLYTMQPDAIDKLKELIQELSLLKMKIHP